MKRIFLIVLIFSGTIVCVTAQIKTVCNPVNLSYMFSSDTPSYREGADPSIVLFKDEYYLFLSKSGGYFHSTDLITWDLIKTASLPLDNYAPTAVVIGDEIYFMTSGWGTIYKTADPKSGKWEVAKNGFSMTYTDPMLFLDDDGRLYYYAGCSNQDPLMGAEIDAKTFNRIGQLKNLIYNNKEVNGWEVPGNYNTSANAAPWLEGSWMIKHDGRYYLQYASPGTEFKSYNDGVYVSDNPLGPFELAKHNPFAYKPEGFLCGTGHGCTFQDKYGNYWHAGTATISKRHSFERRINLYPVFFDEDEVMYAYTGFGDYPMIIPDYKITSPEELFPGWMLLSYKKPVEVSSVYQDFSSGRATDEDIQTWWSAQTGNPDEFITIDLGEIYDVYAVQVNFADQDAAIAGRKDNIYYQYKLYCSDDGENWDVLVDKSDNTIDAPHDYIPLSQPVNTRYIKLSDVKMPSGKLSVFDLRIFGKGYGEAPAQVSSFDLQPYGTDKRVVTLYWTAGSPNTTGYIIRYGQDKNKLYHNYMVYNRVGQRLSSLNANQNYYFTIDAFNENGIARGTEIKQLREETSIHSISQQDALSFYPNPAGEFITLELVSDRQSEATISLLGLHGGCVLRKTLHITEGINRLQLKIPDRISNGIYLLSCKTQLENRFEKVIIAR